MIRIRLITTANQEYVNASEYATIREILTENDITNLNGAITMLDGCNLRPGDMDKTLPDLGVNEECVLSVVVKTANAAKATIIGSSCVITSDIKLDMLKLIKKHRPKAMNLYQGEGKEKELVFSVDVTDKTAGSMNKFGATFGPHASAEGFATLTMAIEPSVEDPQDFIKEKIGVAMLHLNKLEQTFAAVIDEITEEKTAIDGYFSVQ